jgi:hypothetical protein
MVKTTKALRSKQRTAWLKGVEERLLALSADERQQLIEELIADFFVDARAALVKWSKVTGQSAQIDTGYIAQHLASLVLQTPGQGFKGKGLDLIGGSEVKSASIVAGSDRTRWNHELGTAVKDRKSRDAKKKTKSDIYLDETPFIFYVLFDRVYDGVGAPTSTLRIRGWCVNAHADEGWRSLIGKFLQAREEEHLNPPEGKRVKKRHNLQLHPPIGWDNSTVVNKLGNLDMTRALVLDVHFEDPPAGEKINARWEVARLDVPPDFDSGCLLGAYVPGTNPTRPEEGIEGLTNLENPQLTLQYEDAPAAANEAGVSEAVADASEPDALPDDFEEES